MTGNHEFEIAVTGRAWMGKGVGSIWTMIEENVLQATDEILSAAYAISKNSPELFDLIEKVLVKGIRVVLIVNRFGSQPDIVRERLLGLNKRFKDFILKDFSPQSTSEDLHAKLLVIDHSVALVGSANLTWKGMILNHELMVRISGKSASEIGKLVDRLSASEDTRPMEKTSR
jgi:phosphatidylserine/phosphatidylglycerophosphate/cardiolipin synthase-like enzyme